VITPTVTGTAGSNGWYLSAVTVTWSVTDPESGIGSSTGCETTGLTSDTAGTILTCSASNGAGLGASIAVTVRIDRTLPNITCAANPTTLWPPNGKPVVVTVFGAGIDATAGVDSTSLTYAVTDEYGQVQPKGTGVFAASGSYLFGLSLIADRNGTDKDGRRYTVAVSGKDKAGNAASCSAVVTVPHNQGHSR